MKLKDKIVVITGASEGIGKEIALRLAKENMQLALIARNEENLRKVCEEARKLGAQEARGYPCDLRKTDRLNKTVKDIIKDFGYVDILVNNAGVWQKMGPVEEISEAVVDNVIQTNLLAVIHSCRLFLPHLKKKKEAAIINISSKSGVMAQDGQSVYTASKYGVRGFTNVLKKDLKGTGVKVAGVYQGGTNTNLFAKTGENISTDQFTNPADLADVIAYMLSRPERIWLDEVRVDR